MFVFSFYPITIFLFIGSMRQIKLAVCQLLVARKYSVSYSIASFYSDFLQYIHVACSLFLVFVISLIFPHCFCLVGVFLYVVKPYFVLIAQ